MANKINTKLFGPPASRTPTIETGITDTIPQSDRGRASIPRGSVAMFGQPTPPPVDPWPTNEKPVIPKVPS
jgi:hypothetical protein